MPVIRYLLKKCSLSVIKSSLFRPVEKNDLALDTEEGSVYLEHFKQVYDN